MSCLAADVAVPRESATLILLRLTRATLALETGAFLAVLLRPLLASGLAQACHCWFQGFAMVPLGLLDQLLPLLY